MRHLIGGLGLIFLLPLFGAEQEAPPPERPPAAKLVLAVLPFLDLATKQEETLGIGSTLATELQEPVSKMPWARLIRGLCWGEVDKFGRLVYNTSEPGMTSC